MGTTIPRTALGQMQLPSPATGASWRGRLMELPGPRSLRETASRSRFTMAEFTTAGPESRPPRCQSDLGDRRRDRRSVGFLRAGEVAPLLEPDFSDDEVDLLDRAGGDFLQQRADADEFRPGEK